ncbi:hypothetical protein PF003_g9329 [Phytophthora fragariae]|nr:hypothetical protein PF003_g9329 [Phytophthora fragariae]
MRGCAASTRAIRHQTPQATSCGEQKTLELPQVLPATDVRWHDGLHEASIKEGGRVGIGGLGHLGIQSWAPPP